MNYGNSNNSRSSVPMSFMVAFGFIIVFGGLLIGIVFTPLIFPPQASAQSQQIDELFKILLILGGAIFILVQGLLLYSVIRFRVAPDDTTDGPPIHGNATLELIWTAIPAVIVLVLVALSYVVWVDIRKEIPNENVINGEVIPVTATAQRFAWSFSYESPLKDADDNPIIVNSPILHTFVGQSVNISLQSRDVIHSFWVPALRMKQDVIPGYSTNLRFTITEPQGVTAEDYPLQYRVVCAELCGSGHGDMWAYIVIHQNEEAFLDAFYSPEIDKALNPPDDPVLLGEQVLASGKYPCANCHILDNFSWAGLTGPALNGIGDRASRRRPGYTAEEYLVESLYHPSDYLVPGFAALMPQFGTDTNPMPAADLKAIVAYLCTITETGESACNLDNIDSVIATNMN